MNCCSLETDVIFFHPADSGRVIHVGPTTIKVLNVAPVDALQPSPRVTFTSSGRAVRSRFHQLDDDPMQETFRLLEYEDELDLLAIGVTNGEDEEGRALIQLHDNQTGRLRRKIDLVEPWDETYPHELFFDKDTIVHIEQKSSNFCCHVYKLRTIRK
ncbi:hypothetical protein XENOCAPTIV_027867 [Xenoophorus captivus]|uniref:Uncharacterized protein n=1 Tax=Xenoophorus captivus TaxID=1517983 RepID=A0ABV0QKT0_9TELE